MSVLTVAPTTKKVGAGSASKSGTGFITKSSSGKSSSSPFGTSGKTTNSMGGGKSGTKTEKSGSFMGSSGTTRSTLGSTGKSGSLMSSTSKSGNFLGSSSKGGNFLGSSGTSGSLMGSSGKSASSLGSSEKSGSFIGGTGKTTSPPLLIGSKRSTAFTTSPSKSNPSTSFVTPKKATSTFGILWIPTKRRHKKEYVHVAHNYNGAKDRSPSMYHYDHMSGDSPHLSYKKKEEETNLLLLERPKGPIATAASAGTVAATVEPSHDNSEPTNPDDRKEKQQFITHDNDKDETKNAPGDANYRKDNKDDNDNRSYLENDCVSNKSPESKWEDRGDKVDSVYLRPPPPHKVRSNASTTEEEEDCGIKCLYYTLQCCDCVLM